MSVVWVGGTAGMSKLWYMYFALELVSSSMGVLLWYEYVAWSMSMGTLSECRINLTPLSLFFSLLVGWGTDRPVPKSHCSEQPQHRHCV